MRRLPIILALCLATGAAAAQELAPLNDLAACRLDAATVLVSFSYDGGACEKTGDAEAVTKDGVTTVSVPIVPTAEVCTMQVVKVQSASSVAVAEDVTSIELQLLSPGGEVQAEGKTDIAANSPDCVAPKAE
jgi:hypothetical protein